MGKAQVQSQKELAVNTLERHTSLPYLWYSGSISEEQFLGTALAQL